MTFDGIHHCTGVYPERSRSAPFVSRKILRGNAENRVIRVDAGSTAGYVYDAEGRRVHKTVSPLSKDYVFNLASNVVAEIAPTRGWQVGYNYLNGQLQSEYTNNTTYFIHGDHLGSARLLTGMNQALVQNLDYLPFGENNSTDSGISTHEFTGDERDSETSLDHTQFRQYTFLLGRWLSPDPAGLAAVDPGNPQSWNRYAYVLNNPLSHIDPLGLYVAGPGQCEGASGDPCGGGGVTAPGDDGTTYYLDGLQTSGSTVQWLLSIGAAGICPGNNCGPYAGNNGYLYQITLTSEGFSYINPLSGAEFSDGSELGLPNLDDPLGLFPYAGGAGPQTQQSGCLATNIAQINRVSNLNVSPSNLVGTSYMFNGGENFDFSVPGASPSSLAPGRYPSSVFNFITGIGPSLHVPPRGGNDPSTYGIGPNGAFTFTTHMDSAYSTWHTPVGAFIHWFVDVRDKGAHRKPC